MDNINQTALILTIVSAVVLMTSVVVLIVAIKKPRVFSAIQIPTKWQSATAVTVVSAIVLVLGIGVFAGWFDRYYQSEPTLSPMPTPTHTTTPSPEPSPEPSQSSAYQAYYYVLQAAIDEFGYGREASQNGWITPVGVLHAELIYFENDEFPILFYMYVPEDSSCCVFYRIYGFTEEGLKLYYATGGIGDWIGLYIATDRNDNVYFCHWFAITTSPWSEIRYYYTMVNRQWTIVLNQSISYTSVYNETYGWYDYYETIFRVDGHQVSVDEFEKAPEMHLDIVEKQSFSLWEGEFDLETVQNVLDYLSMNTNTSDIQGIQIIPFMQTMQINEIPLELLDSLPEEIERILGSYTDRVWFSGSYIFRYGDFWFAFRETSNNFLDIPQGNAFLIICLLSDIITGTQDYIHILELDELFNQEGHIIESPDWEVRYSLNYEYGDFIISIEFDYYVGDCVIPHIPSGSVVYITIRG